MKETVTGAKLELFSRKTGVSTSVDGESIGTVTFDKAGKAVAVDIPGATITEDGRVIVGKSYERYGVSVTFKAAAKPGEIVRGAGSEFVSGIANNVGGKLGNR